MKHPNRVVVTGAGGTVGKAFARLLVSKKIEVIAVDNHEWALAQLKNDLPEVSIVLDDFSKVDLDYYNPDVIVHCAAYKHVNYGEEDIDAFVLNNVLKTSKMFKEAKKYAIPVLFISTDKAVEPIGVYGYTKAIGEALAKKYKFTLARMGNVLSSTGSVIPTWEKQIEEKQPITITDQRMTRYVIEDYDAVNQIWHEFIQGKKFIVPKMKEVRLMDLLTDVLKRHGYDSPDGYEAGVVEIGIRPGEKLQEKLTWENECRHDNTHAVEELDCVAIPGAAILDSVYEVCDDCPTIVKTTKISDARLE